MGHFSISAESARNRTTQHKRKGELGQTVKQVCQTPVDKMSNDIHRHCFISSLARVFLWFSHVFDSKTYPSNYIISHPNSIFKIAFSPRVESKRMAGGVGWIMWCRLRSAKIVLVEAICDLIGYYVCVCVRVSVWNSTTLKSSAPMRDDKRIQQKFRSLQRPHNPTHVALLVVMTTAPILLPVSESCSVTLMISELIMKKRLFLKGYFLDYMDSNFRQ